MPFPFTDLSATKQRPALVVSPTAWNAVQPDVVLVAITSQIPSTLAPGEVLLAAAELASGGLPKASLVRTAKMHQPLLRRTLGHLPDETTGRVLASLRGFFS